MAATVPVQASSAHAAFAPLGGSASLRSTRGYAVGGVRVLVVGGGTSGGRDGSDGGGANQLASQIRAAAGPRGVIHGTASWSGCAKYIRGGGSVDLVIDACTSTRAPTPWERRLLEAAARQCGVVAIVPPGHPVTPGDGAFTGYLGFVQQSTGTDGDVAFTTQLTSHLSRALAARQAARRVAVLEARCRRLARERDGLTAEVGRLVASAAEQRAGCDSLIAEAAMVAEFRTLVTMELDLDSTLRVGLSAFVLRTGAANAALLLPSPDGKGNWRVAAYLKSTRTRHAVEGMLRTFAEEHAPEVASQRSPIKVQPNTTTPHWSELHGALFGWSALVTPCWGESAPEAVILAFRDAERAYEPLQVRAGELLGAELGRVLERNRRVQSRSAA